MQPPARADDSPPTPRLPAGLPFSRAEMADVPEEAVRFARMAIRAFYPADHAVVADGVLRQNNFCSHAALSAQLRMRPKELRQILSRMVSARLMESEKHQQKRINYKDERQPGRIVQTEYWYVPLPKLIDAFQYRVDHIALKLEEQIRLESEEDMYKCQQCGRQYKLVDICANIDPDSGAFYCDAILRNRRPCNGEIKEEDNSSRLKETEAFKKQFEENLRPLCLLAQQCNALEIPVHPMDGADEETWERYVPKMIGVRGEVVDAEGLNADLAAEVNEDGGAAKTPGIVNFGDHANGGGDSAVIPDRPSWFKAGGKDDDEDDDDWEDNEAGAAGAAAQPAFGTGAMFGRGTDLENYMKALGGTTDSRGGEDGAPEDAAKAEKTGATSDAAKIIEANEAAELALSTDADKAQSDAATAAIVTPAGQADESKKGEAEEPHVLVKGVKYALSSITEELAEEMTQEEFRQYCELRATGDDDDDDDVEFE